MPPYLNAVIGEYRITGYLGEGGMGQVYRAVHTLLGHTVAIKILNQGSGDSVLVQRFLNEARIQASLRHPGIAAFYEFTEFRGKPVIVMEFVDRGGLRMRCRCFVPAPPHWNIYTPKASFTATSRAPISKSPPMGR